MSTALTRSSLLSCLVQLLRVTSWRLVLALALMACAGLTEGIGFVVLLPLLHLVGVTAPGGVPSRLEQLSAAFLSAIGVPPALGPVLILYAGTVLGSGLIDRWQSVVNVRVQTAFTGHLRVRLYRAITETTWTFFSRCRPSELAHAVTFETNLVGEMTANLLFLLATTLVASVHVSVSLQLSATVTAVVLACGGALLLLLRRHRTRSQVIGTDLLAATRALYTTVVDHLASLKTAKSYDAVERNVAIVTRLDSAMAGFRLHATRADVDAGYWFRIGCVALLGVAVYVAVNTSVLSPAELLVLLLLFARLMPKFSAIQQIYQRCVGLGPAFARLMELETRCRSMAEPGVDRADQLVLREAIRFERVTFRYATDEEPALCELDLTIRRGQTTAVVGPSGAGKSTIADLLIGLVAPQQGRVLVDGVLLRPEQLSAWRAQIGLVAQDPYLLNDTVAANLLWACPGANDTDIARALGAAAADFVFELPEGLDTVIGDRGVRLSGGQRQRLVLAGALLRRPALLILDEATSAVDSETEQRIQRAIEALHGRITIVVITHRLSTVRRADAIHVLEDGRVVESGTWDTLIEKQAGRFHALCRAQGFVDGPGPDARPNADPQLPSAVDG